MRLSRGILTPFVTTALVISAWTLPAAAQLRDDSSKETGAQGTSDPLQSVNRVTSEFNRVLRQWIIDPVVDGYQAITPDEVQAAVSNVVSNATEPLTIASSLLQGDTENAGVATKRFIINTAAGIGGINDVATGDGYEQRREDLGQALGAHGVAPGPHIVLPIIGPSNARDAAADIALLFVNPLPIGASVGAGGVEYSDKQDTVQSIGEDAIDPYVAERDLYEQNRRFVINNGQQVEIPVIANFE